MGSLFSSFRVDKICFPLFFVIRLKTVLSHGTENRLSIGRPAIPPSQEVHMGIRFHQEEIEDIVQIEESARYSTTHNVTDALIRPQQGTFQQQRQPPPQQQQQYQQQYGGWGQPPPQPPPPHQYQQPSQQGYQQQSQQGFGQAPAQGQQQQQPAGLVPPPARPGAVPAQSVPAPAKVIEAAKPAYVKPTSFAAAAQVGLPTSKPKPPPPDRSAPQGGRGAGGRIPQPRGGRGGGRFGNVSNQNLPQSAVVPTEAFDFESMLSKFDKAREQTANDLGIAKYDKDDFFDTMSSDTTQKENRSAHFQRMAEQRKVDSETFGREGATHTSIHGRGR